MSAIPLPNVRTETRPLTRTRAVSKQRKVVGEAILAYSAAFAFLVAATYGASSLAGQTMMEQARREGLHAKERALDARKDVATLRQRVERLVGMRSIDQWASVRGFVTEGALVSTPKTAKPRLTVMNSKAGRHEPQTP
jgi:hypothetical protein